MRIRMVIAVLVPVLAAMSISAKAQEAAVSSSPNQYVLDLGVGIQYQPKYPGSDDYILVPFPLVAVQRLFLPGFGQVVDGEEKLRAFSVFPSFDFNGKREASDLPELTGPKPSIGRWNWASELDTATTGCEAPSKFGKASMGTTAKS